MKYPKLIIQIDEITPVSTNEMYSYGRKTVRKSAKLKAYTDSVLFQLKGKLKEEDILSFQNCLKEDYRRAIYVDYIFSVPKRSYFRADTSNYPKALEDIIKNIIDIDDTRNVKLSAEKILSSDKNWHITMTMQIYDLQYEIPADKWTNNILGSNNKTATTSLLSDYKVKSKIKPIKTRKTKKTSKKPAKKEKSSSSRKALDKRIKEILISDTISKSTPIQVLLYDKS